MPVNAKPCLQCSPNLCKQRHQALCKAANSKSVQAHRRTCVKRRRVLSARAPNRQLAHAGERKAVRAAIRAPMHAGRAPPCKQRQLIRASNADNNFSCIHTMLRIIFVPCFHSFSVRIFSFLPYIERTQGIFWVKNGVFECIFECILAHFEDFSQTKV